MRYSIFLIAACVVGWFAPASELFADDKAEIRRLIPAATSMTRKYLMTMLKAQTPKASDFEDKSLTLMLLVLPISEDREAKKEFRFLNERLTKPQKILEEVYRGGVVRKLFPNSPITFIHADRITDVTCKAKGDTATGTISFKVPSLCEGKVNYKAIRKSGKWRITELKMPANKIHIARDDKGVWRKK